MSLLPKVNEIQGTSKRQMKVDLIWQRTTVTQNIYEDAS